MPMASDLVSRSRPITSGAPVHRDASAVSNRATPGEHGIAGYASEPFDGSFLNALFWADGLSSLTCNRD